MTDDSPEEIVVHTPQYHIATQELGDFLLIRLRGRYSDAMIDHLRNSVFLRKTNFAIDASALEGMTVALARELIYTSKLLESTDHRLVLLRPTERLKSLLTLSSGGVTLPLYLAEEQLRSGGPAADSRIIHEARELERVKDEIQSNPRWQFIDREGHWICPYCAQPQPDVGIPSHMSVPAAAAEKAFRHLWFKCAQFAPGQERIRSIPELQEALRKANEGKVVVTKRRIESLEDKEKQV
ncbi:MAG TPA: hypothetical protein VJB14_00515, partial [Planctomycetota bacterium]|nr:hypothetical protein [Planctomycetota bacterium]